MTDHSASDNDRLVANVRPLPADRHVSFSEAFRFWVKLGFISFGGPAGQIAIMHRELVERRRWLSEERFLHALNYCMLLPGPEAQQLAVYIGWLMHRTWGGIVAGAFFVIPSIFVLLLLSWIYAAYGNVPFVLGMLDGFKPVVVAIVVEAVVKIGKRALRRRVHYLIAALAFIAIYFLQVPFPFIVLAAAVVGFLGTRFLGSSFSPPPDSSHDPAAPRSDTKESLLIADDKVQLEHTVPNRRRIFNTLALGMVLWLTPLIAIALVTGTDGLFVREYQFFSVSALVTFGGAYAVLAYVTQAVTTPPFDWITPSQAVDGLALAETTPGPLIMVLQFVGFMAGWNNPPNGMTQLSSGVVAAVIATYTTFLPSFLFIFIGAPFIEKLRGNILLGGVLTGVTSAVVGVILNLALVFGSAVFLAQNDGLSINWFSIVLTAAAFIALYKLKLDVLWVVLIGGITGLLRLLAGF